MIAIHRSKLLRSAPRMPTRRDVKQVPRWLPRAARRPRRARGGSGMGRSRDRRRDQQQAWCYAKAGQALPEFVLVLPILILIFMGVLDLGRAFHTHVAVSNAARVGVIYAQQVTTPGAGNCASDT